MDFLAEFFLFSLQLWRTRGCTSGMANGGSLLHFFHPWMASVCLSQYYQEPLIMGPLPVAFSLQSQQQSPSNTLSSLSTSTACVTPQTSLKQLKKSERSATTTQAWGSPATPTATPSSSGSSTSASATGSSCPSAWCWPARSSCVLSSS